MEGCRPDDYFACAFIVHSDQIATKERGYISILVCRKCVGFVGTYVHPAPETASVLEENSTSSVSAATRVGWAANSFSATVAASSFVAVRR